MMDRRLRCTEAKHILLRRLRGQLATNSGRWTRDDLYDQQEEPVSTKTSIKYHKEEGTQGGWFHLYNEIFDEDYVYLEFGDAPFQATSCAHLDTGAGPGSVAVRIPNDWARRLGLIGNDYLDNEDGELLPIARDTLSGGEKEPEPVVEMKHTPGPPARGFAYTRPDGTIIVNSVRETRAAVRLIGSEGVPVPVMITQVPDDGTAQWHRGFRWQAFPNPVLILQRIVKRFASLSQRSSTTSPALSAASSLPTSAEFGTSVPSIGGLMEASFAAMPSSA